MSTIPYVIEQTCRVERRYDRTGLNCFVQFLQEGTSGFPLQAFLI